MQFVLTRFLYNPCEVPYGGVGPFPTRMTTNVTNQGQVPDVDFVALQPGQTIGRYEIVAILGQGGFGITYRARDAQLNREVAIKEYLPSALAVRQDGITVLPRTTKMADDFTWGRQRFVEETTLLKVGQQCRGAALLLTVFQQGRPAAGGIGRDRAQQPFELLGTRAVELAIGAARQLGDLREQPRRHAIVALLEDEHRQAEQAELARLVADLVDILLAAVADEHHRVEPALAPLLGGVAQQAGDLRAAGQAAHRPHQARQLAAVGRPAADLELVEAAIEGQPDLDAADFARRNEHLALLRRGCVPGRLAAGRRIHGEQQPPAPAAAGRLRRQVGHFPREGVDRGRARRGALGRAYFGFPGHPDMQRKNAGSCQMVVAPSAILAR